MRQQDKKQVRAIVKKLNELYDLIDELTTNHEEWIDEKSCDVDGWENTETGERASEDHYTFEEWHDTIDNLREEIADYINLDYTSLC